MKYRVARIILATRHGEIIPKWCVFRGISPLQTCANWNEAIFLALLWADIDREAKKQKAIK